MSEALTTMMDGFARAGYARVDPPILQPAEVFLDLSGEELRRRLLLVSDPAASDTCLRPDMTIPVSRMHMETGDAARGAAYCYLGPVFRHRAGSGEPDEFLQAGIERFGAGGPDADAEILKLGLDAAATLGATSLTVRLGDPALFLNVVSKLEVPVAWQRRLRAAFGADGAVAAVLESAGAPQPAEGTASAYAEALSGVDPKIARRLVGGIVDLAGIAPVGGRSADEIADRLIERAALANPEALVPETVEIVSRLAQVTGAPRTAQEEIAGIASEAGISVDDALNAFAARLDAFEAAGLDVSAMRFSASFGRRLDYYSGFVFEAVREDVAGLGPVVGGGRYDKLLGLLGSAQDVPGVGCAIWIDRAGRLA